MKSRGKKRVEDRAEHAEGSVNKRLWWLLGVSPVLVAVARVVGFSKGDQALLATIGGTLDVRAILIASIPPTALLAILLFAYVAIGDPKLSGGIGSWWRSLSFVEEVTVLALLMLLVLVTDYFTVLWGSLLVLGAIVLRWIIARRARSRGERFSGFNTDAAAVLSSILVFNFLIGGSMWLPVERVRGPNGLDVNAYVLSAQGDWTTILVQDDRRVLRVKTEAIVERTVCNESATRTLAQLFSPGANQPECVVSEPE